MRFLNTVALAALAMTAIPAAAEVRLDQDAFVELSSSPDAYYLTSTSVLSGPTGKNLLQSFTAGLTGKLSLLNLQGYYGSYGAQAPASVTLALFNGSQTPAATKTFSSNLFPTLAAFNGGSTAQIDVSSLNFSVSAGQQYAFLLFVSPATNGNQSRLGFAIGSCTSADEDFNCVGQVDNQYAGGSASWVNHADGSITPLGNDRGFQTFVDVAPVPEPGEWALIGAGLAIVGGMAKRRRKS